MTWMSLFLDVSVAFLILVSAYGLGLLALRVSQVSVDSATSIFLSSSLGLGAFSWLMFLLGLSGLWYRSVTWGLITIGLISGWLSGPIKLQISPNTWKAKIGQWLKDWECWPFAGLLVIGLGSAVWVMLTHALMPPFEWDEISYHLPLIKIYINQHRIVYVPFIIFSTTPLQTNMLYGLSLMMEADIAHHFIMWSMSILTAFGLYIIAARYIEPRVGILVAALYLTIPLIKRLSGTGLIDVAMGFYATATLLAFSRWREERTLAWLGLVSLFSGFTAGTKLMGASFPLIFGLLWLWRQRQQHAQQLLSVLKQATVLIGGVFVIVGPWYVRSYLVTGNPVWPFFYDLFGGRNWDWLGDEYSTQLFSQFWAVDLPPSLGGFFLSMWYVLFDPAKLGGYGGGIGKLVPTLAAASIPLLSRSPKWIRDSFFVCLAYYVMWFALASRQVRYLTPIMPLLCLLGGFVFFWVWGRVRFATLRLTVVGTIILILIIDFPFFDSIQRDLLIQRWSYVSGQISKDKFLDQHIRIMPALRYINRHLNSKALVLLLPFETRGYYLDRAYFWGHLGSQRVIRFEEYDSPTALAETLRNMGVTHVLDNPEWVYEDLPHWEHNRALMLALEDDCGQPIFQEGDIILYKLSSCTDEQFVVE